MSTRSIGVTDARSLPVYFIPRVLLTVYKPSSNAILAYNALACYADGSRCRNLGIKTLAASVDISETTMKQSLAELVKIKAVIVKRREKKQKTGGPIQLPSEYILIDLPERQDLPI